MEHVSALQLAARLADASLPRPYLLDVREQWEFDICKIEGATLIPMHTIPARIDDLDEDVEIVCICHHGARSLQVAAFLEHHGFGKISNLTGGMHAWAVQVDSSMSTY